MAKKRLNFNRLSRVHKRYRQTDDGRTGDSIKNGVCITSKHTGSVMCEQHKTTNSAANHY